MTEAELNVLLDLRSENERVEFKEAKNNFHFEKLVDYCVALANEGGGRIVLGVSDKPPRRVVGTAAFEMPEKTVAGVYERIHLKLLWQEIQHAEGRVLVFEAPARPVGHPLHDDGGYWMRAGEELVPMTPDQLNDFEAVARKGVRLIVYEGVSKQKVRDGKDITGQKGYAVACEGLVELRLRAASGERGERRGTAHDDARIPAEGDPRVDRQRHRPPGPDRAGHGQTRRGRKASRSWKNKSVFI